MRILTNRFPGGRKKALTMSYDDGVKQDIRLAELLSKHNIKGTFHLNSSTLDTPGYLSCSDVTELAAKHEISAHSKTHPHLEKMPLPMAVQEMMDDRRRLEEIIGNIVSGMSYPFGGYSDNLINALSGAGIVYSRTVEATNDFKLPDDFMKWHPTTHHNGDLTGLWERYMARDQAFLQVFYLWGHSYEFDNDSNWSAIEDFCKLANNCDDIWYATNIEIYEYAQAIGRLRFSIDGQRVLNPSAIDIWLTVEGRTELVPAGREVKFR